MTITNNFNDQTPPRIQALIGHGDSLAKARLIQDRAEELLSKLDAHYARHKSAFVARETLKVFEEQYGRITIEHRPDWALESHFSCRSEARKRVALRHQGRRNAIEQSAKNMQRQLPRNEPSPQDKHLAMQEIKAIDLRGKAVLNKASTHFKAHKDLWITQQFCREGMINLIPICERQNARVNRINEITERMKQQVQYKYGLRHTPPRPHQKQRERTMTQEHLPTQ